ncbi:hypothetical protein MMC12_000105 [Toensbergia leucococca]|nr:hypothetical protein [Toensbergia leucococca]
MDVVTALFSAASKLNDSQATFEIIRQAIRTSRLSRPEIHGPRRQLAGFAEAKDPEALILECQVCESEGKPKLALKLYKEVTEIQTRTGDNTKALDRSIAEAWKSISRLQIQAGHLTSAKVAIEKGALQYDDPLAYYYLAKFFEDSSSDDYLNHMLKAAASGVPQAANEIGMYYYKQMQTQKQEDSVDNRLLAQEWFAVGAECDIESSQVYLAILLRRAGKLADGLRWLEKVSHSKEWRSAIPWLKQVWGQTSFDLTKHDVETIRNVDKVMKKRSKSTSTS